MDFRQLWTLAAGKNGFSLDQEVNLPLDGKLPEKAVAKDWKTLFQPKLNIALLPVDKVFLRVIHLPVSEFGETVSMVELQMEKLSPLPVTQVVWSIQVLPHTVENLQTVIVIIAARDTVEETLGQLESQGFLTDRLELPVIDQLLATPITGDGAWVYPAGNGRRSALVGWWYGGVLENLGLLHVPANDERGESLKEQLTQMAWAGELEGWLTGAPQWRLVADEMTTSEWQPMFRAWLGQTVEVIVPLSPPELAALTANRAARAERRSNILPEDYSSRYQQQFYDRLWMKSMGTVLAAWAMIVMGYFAALTFQNMKADGLDRQVGGVYGSYTNALRAKAQLQILQDRSALKYASLDCWKATAELLPEGFTVRSLDFRNGKLSVEGVAPVDAAREVTAFVHELEKATLRDGQLVFSKVNGKGTRIEGANLAWGFTADVARMGGTP
jgi:hypothetical protein